jgi:hypothetical protein
MFLIGFFIPLVVLGGLTVVVAGTVAAMLVLRSAAPRPMMITGVAGTLLSYPFLLAAHAYVPTVAEIGFNGVTVYPVWATVVAVVVALVWRLGRALIPAESSAVDMEAERIRRARERARKYHGSDG